MVEIPKLLNRFVLGRNFHQTVHRKVWCEVFTVELSDAHEIDKLELEKDGKRMQGE